MLKQIVQITANHIQNFLKNNKQKAKYFVSVIALMPAAATGSLSNTELSMNMEVPQELQAESAQEEPLPSVETLKITRLENIELTAFSSTRGQTDSTPFITASGTKVRDGVVATNMLPFGTKIRIPEFFGDKVFVVEDRMNKRYQKTVDIWVPTKKEAYKIGRQTTYIEIIEEI